MTPTHDPPLLQEVESILDRLEHLGDPAVRADARDLIRLVLRLHGEALARLVQLTCQTPAGPALLAVWKDDPTVASLLLLHGLHPDELAVRVRRAMADVQPVADFLGVGVRVAHVEETSVRLVLTPAPEVPAPALEELQARLEAAILAQAPDIETVQFEGGLARRIGLPLVGLPLVGPARLEGS
jgi:hypothetical protein